MCLVREIISFQVSLIKYSSFVDIIMRNNLYFYVEVRVGGLFYDMNNTGEMSKIFLFVDWIVKMNYYEKIQ